MLKRLWRWMFGGGEAVHVDEMDPVAAAVIKEAFRTGKITIGRLDANGNLTIEHHGGYDTMDGEE